MNYPALIVILSAAMGPAGLWLVRLLWPEWCRRAEWRIWGAIRLAAQRPWLVVFGPAMAVLSIRIALLPLWPIPAPSVLDEFSYLLMADTFASGKMANPTHPLWPHFETLFVLQQPTYSSVYPVVQGLFLAAGQVVAGHPWLGVWLSVGIMCASVSWAIQGWVPRRWALLGTLWIALQVGLTTYWIDSYWGGAASATGGALLAGAAGRLQRRMSARHCLVLAVGLAILANTRPYEGFILGLVTVGWLITRTRVSVGRLLAAAAPAALFLAAAGLCMGFYFWRVTGNPLKMPQQAYIEKYAASPAFFWQKKPPEPVYRDSVLRAAHLSFLNEYKRFDTLGDAVKFSLEKLRMLGTFYLGPLIFVPILGLPFLIRAPVRLPLFAVAASLGGILLTVSVQPHYGAPLTAFLVVLTLNSLRYFEASRRFGNPIGDFLGPTAALVCVAYIAFSALVPHQKVILAERPKVIDFLRRQQGGQLVIVRYSPDHALAEEWVYNAADIDRAKIVWARDMGPAGNVELLRYYPDRRVWLLLPDSALTQLVPYHDPVAEPGAGHLGLVH